MSLCPFEKQRPTGVVTRLVLSTEIIQFERMVYVSPPMGELIVDVSSELAHKLTARRRRPLG